MRRGLLLLALSLGLTACGSSDRVARRWAAPGGTFPGLEVVAIDRWSASVGVGRQFLELHCAHRPWQRVRREYRAVPEWNGEVRWAPGRVWYDPGPKSNLDVPGVVFTVADLRWLRNCPT